MISCYLTMSYPYLHISTANDSSRAQAVTAMHVLCSTSLWLDLSKLTSGGRPPALCSYVEKRWALATLQDHITYHTSEKVVEFNIWFSKMGISVQKMPSANEQIPTSALASKSQASRDTHSVTLTRITVSLDFKGSTRALMAPCAKRLLRIPSFCAMLPIMEVVLATVLGQLAESCWTRSLWPPAWNTALKDVIGKDVSLTTQW